MKKFISVLLAILMVVAVMPFAIFAADDAAEESPLHPCHPDSLANIDLNAASVKVKAKTDADVHAGVLVQYLTDGNKTTATRLPTGDKVTFAYTFTEDQAFAEVKVVVNGKGNINPGDTTEGKVIADSNHDFKVQVIVKNDIGQVIYKSDEVSTKDQTELVFKAYKTGRTIEVITDAAEKTTGGPRIWEISANAVRPESEYEHDLEEIVVKASTTKTPGTAYLACKNCDYEEEEYDLPLLTGEDLTGGVLGLDDVTIEEYIKEVDGEGNVKKDDDGNDIIISKPLQANPEALFDGNKNSGGLWNANGSYWTAAPGGKLTIKFNEPKLISYLNITVTFNGWPGVIFSFYNGDTLVGIDGGNWKAPEDPDYNGPADRWTNTWENKTINFAAADYADLEGKVIDTIVIEITNHGTHNYRKISEIEVGCHTHVFSEADIKANGTQGTGADVCKWTHDATCLECETKVNDAIAYLHDVETTVIKEATCGNGIYSDKCKTAGCTYESGEYTVAGTGDHDFSTHVTQSKYATCGADGVSNFVCSVCRERQEMTGFEVLLGKKLAADLVVGPFLIAKSGTVITEEILDNYMMVAESADELVVLLSSTDIQSGAAVTSKFKATMDFTTETEKYVVGTAANGYHTMGWKNIVPSDYTIHGTDIAYCTTCGLTNDQVVKPADYKSVDTVVRVRLNGFTLRTTDFEGIRATFTVNKDLLNEFIPNHSVRIWVIATNSKGETSEIQVYGAGAKNLIDNNGKFSVVVKDVANAKETIKFTLKISVKDANGENISYREVGSTSVAAVKATGK